MVFDGTRTECSRLFASDRWKEDGGMREGGRRGGAGKQSLYGRGADKPASERHRALPKPEALCVGRLVAHGLCGPPGHSKG